MRRLIGAVGTLLLLSLNLACTRDLLGGEKIRLVIPFNNGNSDLAAGDVMKFAVVNIQVPGRPLPIVKEFDFDNNPIPWGVPIDLEIKDVPSGPGLLIQFMGVFDTASGAAYLITYGDVLATINKGSNIINLAAVPAGTANKEGRVSGRYFTDMDGGPTGTLVSFFYPPNNKPRMAVNKTPIVNGWFNTLVLDNIPLTSVVTESGITIFAGLTIGSPALATSANAMKFDTVPYFHKEQRNNTVSVRPQVAGSYYLGFYKNANGPSLSSYRACYLNGATEGLSGWYGVYAAQTLSNPLIYSATSVSNAGLTVAGGGYGVSSSSFYDGSDCNSAGGDLIAYPNQVAQSHDSFSGIKPPFRLIDPYSSYDSAYVRSRMTSGPFTINLKWNYLPGAQASTPLSPVTGVDILYKYSANGGEGSDHDQNCYDYLQKGYTLVGNSTTAAGNYDFTGYGLNGSNYYGYQFALCAYSITNSVKNYIGEVLTSSCVGGCSGGLNHFGWGTGDLTISSPGDADTALGVHYSSVTGVDATTSQFYNVLTVSSLGTPQEFNSGDLGSEILLSVSGMGTAGDCGTFNGAPIQVGQKGYSRLLYGSSALIKIAKGTFVDTLSNANLGASANSTNFCFVQATKVAHFRSLTLNSNVDASPFSYNYGGGILPLRVSGVLSIAGSVTLGGVGRGFSAGLSVGYSGSGHRKNTDTTAAAGNSGGAFSISGGGGGGPTSQGGRGTDGGGAFQGGESGQAVLAGGGGGDFPLIFGGGGGGGNGGSGGSAVFVTARYISSVAGAEISAKAGANSNSAHGGGAGGSVLLMAEKLNGSLHVDARGTAGGVSVNAGGGGGGGAITQYFCTPSLVTTTNVNSGMGAATSNTANGAFDGVVNTFLMASSYNPACQN